ncbi:MAG: homogentisate 1,2-dioxygenase [Acidimicrobiales bacterium]
MPYYRRIGEVPPKRHTQFRRPDGGLYAEELMGEEGFNSDSSLLYHRNPPTVLIDVQPAEVPAQALQANMPLLPRHLKTAKLSAGGDMVLGRQLLLGNDDVRISLAAASEPSGLYRNAIGDEMVFVQAGRATLESVFGRLEANAGDYVIVPRSTTHRWVPAGEVRALVAEAAGHIGPPAKYLSRYGQFLEHAPYCERDLHAPDEPSPVAEDGEAEVLVRHIGGFTRFRYAHHPFDVVGWDGYLYPYRFDIREFEPITGRIHQPPPVHQTFAGPNFVVCSFVPRKFDYHPLSIPAPYNHANVDSDEVLFYVEGDFMSRKGSGIEAGSISVHPNGFIHGPQPGSVEASIGKEATEEVAVMIDTFRPLQLGDAALACENASYAWSWSGGRR